MRYLSLIVLLLIVAWSWSFIHRPATIAEASHVIIQQDLKEIITNYIKENLPTSENLRFERMWTENTKNDRVKASFVYSFEDDNEETGKARVQIEGYALLNRGPSSQDEGEVWNLNELYVLDNQVEFKEGITIVPGADSSN